MAKKKNKKPSVKRKPNARQGKSVAAQATAVAAAAETPQAQTETPRVAEPILPPALDELAARIAGAQLQAKITEAASAPLDDFRRDTLVDPPKVLIEEHHRTLPRVTLEVDVDLSSDSHFFTGLSGDISEGGLFVSTYRSVDVGSEVDLEFSLPTGAVQTRGLVRWHRDASPYGPPGIGIEFDLLSEQERKIIHAFCVARAPLYYDVDQL